MESYPGECTGFISIDSVPLQRKYVTSAEIWMLRNCEWMYRIFPWKLLVKAGSYGCAETEYGRSLMREMMLTYTHDQYCSLAGHGYRISPSSDYPTKSKIPHRSYIPLLPLRNT